MVVMAMELPAPMSMLEKIAPPLLLSTILPTYDYPQQLEPSSVEFPP
jgi:hypothetical protein